jgi:hypothetical protein
VFGKEEWRDVSGVWMDVGIRKKYSGSSPLSFSKAKIDFSQNSFFSFEIEVNGKSVNRVFQVFVVECGGEGSLIYFRERPFDNGGKAGWFGVVTLFDITEGESAKWGKWGCVATRLSSSDGSGRRGGSSGSRWSFFLRQIDGIDWIVSRPRQVNRVLW